MIYHQHLIANFVIKYPPTEINEVWLDVWLRRMIAGQGMQLMKNPQYAYLDRPGLRGWSAFALIETSHVALHTWDETDPATMRLDFYTCGKLDTGLIMKAVEEMKILDSDWWVIDRENRIRQVEVGGSQLSPILDGGAT
jgi:S-adenosylmethionine/arginine decarboxylase-like enzyme